jgi:hypothetical protein
LFRTRRDTALEVLALRQQVAVLKRKRPRPPLNSFDRLFWTTLRRRWPRWVDLLVIVKPETVIGWHRAGFRRYSGPPHPFARDHVAGQHHSKAGESRSGSHRHRRSPYLV